jgi:hypothetical protein
VGSIQQVAVGDGSGGGKAPGWQLITYHTSPEFQKATPQDKIALGEQLDAVHCHGIT